MLICHSGIKEVARDFNVASDFPDAQNKVTEMLVKEALHARGKISAEQKYNDKRDFTAFLQIAF